MRKDENPDACEACGGEGEIWYDVEHPSGKVLEDSRPCGSCNGPTREWAA